MYPDILALNNGKNKPLKIGDRPELKKLLNKSIFNGTITANFVDFSFTKSYTKMVVTVNTRDNRQVEKVNLQIIRKDDGYEIDGKTKSIFDWFLLAIPSADCIDSIKLRFSVNDYRTYIGGELTISAFGKVEKAENSEPVYSDLVTLTADFRIIGDDIEKLAGITPKKSDSMADTIPAEKVNSASDLVSRLAKIQAKKAAEAEAAEAEAAEAVKN